MPRFLSREPLERHAPHALGTLEHPMSDGDLEAKFRGLALGVLSGVWLDTLIAACWGWRG